MGTVTGWMRPSCQAGAGCGRTLEVLLFFFFLLKESREKEAEGRRTYTEVQEERNK